LIFPLSLWERVRVRVYPTTFESDFFVFECAGFSLKTEETISSFSDHKHSSPTLLPKGEGRKTL